jgi:ankyrin repeat protein
VDAPRAEREALALEAVKLVVDLGVDVNTPSSDGRTALDGAKAQRFETVAAFLTQKGAKAGTGASAGGRGGRGGR